MISDTGPVFAKACSSAKTPAADNGGEACDKFRYNWSPVTCHLDLAMSFLDVQQLPFVGMSHEFHGEKQGAPISAYIVNARPGQGPPLHTHPYVEIAFTLEGTALITVGDETREVKAGGIAVIPANTPHRFINSGNSPLRQIDIHASPRFIQTNLN